MEEQAVTEMLKDIKESLSQVSMENSDLNKKVEKLEQKLGNYVDFGVSKEYIDEAYRWHQPTIQKEEKYAKVREMGKAYANLIEEICVDGREKTIAHIKLEEARNWANSSIARHDIEEDS